MNYWSLNFVLGHFIWRKVFERGGAGRLARIENNNLVKINRGELRGEKEKEMLVNVF